MYSQRASQTLRGTSWGPLVRLAPPLVPGRIKSNEADDDVPACRRGLTREGCRRARCSDEKRPVDRAGCGKRLRGRPGIRAGALRCIRRGHTLTDQHSGDGKCSVARRQLMGTRRARPSRNVAGRWQARGRQLARREWRCERRERQQDGGRVPSTSEESSARACSCVCHTRQQPRCQNMPLKKVTLHRDSRANCEYSERDLSGDRLQDCLVLLLADFV